VLFVNFETVDQKIENTKTTDQGFCVYPDMILRARTNNACSPKSTFQYISGNSMEIINNSVFAGFPEKEKKKMAIQWSKAASYIISQCNPKH